MDEADQQHDRSQSEDLLRRALLDASAAASVALKVRPKRRVQRTA